MSSDVHELPRLTIHVQPGSVLVFYFVVFNLFLLTVVDFAIAKTVSWRYYKNIFKGSPIVLKSADVPGITSFLIGDFWSPINVFAFLIKFIFLLIILSIDIGVDSETFTRETEVNVTSRLGFNLTDAYWGKEEYVGSIYLWEPARNCRVKDSDQDDFTFYTIVFNVTGDTSSASILDDTQEYISTESIHCLSPDYATEQSVRPLLYVKGCSPVRNTSCMAPSLDVIGLRNTRTPDLTKTGRWKLGLSNRVAVSIRSYYQFDFEGLWPYPPGNLTCIYVEIGTLSDSGSRDKTNGFGAFQTCLFSTELSEGFLIENWTYNSSEFTRRYPGPVFETNLNIGVQQTLAASLNIVKGNHDYVTLTSILVANGGVPILENQTVVLQQDVGTVTIVPFYVLVLSIIFIIVAIVAFSVVSILLAKDKRPQLNVINGLSSIAREENQPSGRSLTAGRGISMGLILRYRNVARLVPVHTGYDVVRRDDVSEII